MSKYFNPDLSREEAQYGKLEYKAVQIFNS